MRLAMVGTRGVPASYSGFETCVESVGKRLVARGHTVTVYCRPGRTGQASRTYLGMRRVTLPDIPTKGLETLSHSLLSTIHAAVALRPDAVMVFGVGNALFCPVFKRFGMPAAINVDGADWQRRKWGRLASRFLHWSERVSSRANAVVADSRTVAAYYERAYGVPTVFIPYGADVPSDPGRAALDRFGLAPRRYLLAVGRFVPENGFEQLIGAYSRVNPDMPFVVVGDAPYSDDFKRRLKAIAPAGVIFTGYQFGAAYHELSAGAYAFLFGAEVGGTHPVLVEQLAHGNAILARWTESNEEVMDTAGLFYRDAAELDARLGELVHDPGMVERLRARARQRAAAYSWDRVTDEYEALLERLTAVAAREPAQ
jgi:glycosyltransferase involved in cell wall biosynthesis